MFVLVMAIAENQLIYNNVKPYPVICHLLMSKLGSTICMYVSTYNIVFLAIERYSAITKPLQYDSSKVRRRLPIVFIFEWVVMTGLSMFVPATTVATDTQCLVAYKLKSTFKIDFYPVETFIVALIIPVCVMSFCYIRMFQALSKSFKFSGISKTSSMRTEEKNNSSLLHKSRIAQINIFETCFIMTILFVVCWTCLETALLLYIIDYYPHLGNDHYTIGRLMVVANSVINPYIYAIRYEYFKKQIRFILKVCK